MREPLIPVDTIEVKGTAPLIITIQPSSYDACPVGKPVFVLVRSSEHCN